MGVGAGDREGEGASGRGQSGATIWPEQRLSGVLVCQAWRRRAFGRKGRGPPLGTETVGHPKGLGAEARVTDLHSHWLHLLPAGWEPGQDAAWGPGGGCCQGPGKRHNEDQGRPWSSAPYCFPTKSSFGEGGPGMEVNSHGGSGSTGQWSRSGAKREPWRHLELGRGPSREVGCLGWDPRSAAWSFYPQKRPSPSCTPISPSVKWKSLPKECGED